MSQKLKELTSPYQPRKYWEARWKTQPTTPLTGFYKNLKKLLRKHKCDSVLEVGCGEAVGSRALKNYAGLDFSETALEKTQAETKMNWDITQPLPLPENWYDAVLSRMTLLHIPHAGIQVAVDNMRHTAKKLIILCEYPDLSEVHLWRHCFNHNLRKLFAGANVVFVDGDGEANDLVYTQ